MKTILASLPFLFAVSNTFADTSSTQLTNDPEYVSNGPCEGAARHFQEDFLEMAGSNHIMQHWTFTPTNFRELSENPHKLQTWVAAKIKTICTLKGNPDEKCLAAANALQQQNAKVWYGPNMVNGFTNWIFRMSTDNWLNRAELHNLVGQYLSEPMFYEVRYFAKFNPTNVLTDTGLPAEGLPVVFDSDTDSITLWAAELLD